MTRFKSSILLSAVFSATIISQSFAQEAELNPVIVTANPLGRSANELTQPVTVLAGDNLLTKLQPTIGETLSSEPGIRSTYFGPNASRPVIRGLEGDQITILQNGINNLDASVASVDHNVAIDPLTVEKIEVIRGPAALLYGSKAVGGVVNIIDNRIPDQPIAEKLTGLSDARYNTANKERSASMLLEGGVGNYAWHINGFKRITDDVSVPGYVRSKSLRSSSPLSDEPKNKIDNSQSNSDGTTIGLSRFFKKGYFGAAITNYKTNYGTVAEADVTIEMKQQRIDFAGAYQDPNKYIKEVKYKLGISDYEHTEFEGSAEGTVFKNKGYDGRLEFIHNKLGLFEGSVGFQSGESDFSALGDEAFLPTTITKTNSGFIFEEIPFNNITIQTGARIDHQTIDSETSANFTNEYSRDDLTGSGSLGAVYDFNKAYSAAISTSYTQRAPNAQELYANGHHVATDTYEVGSRDLNVQKSYGVDLSLRKKTGIVNGEFNLFYNKFQNFITLTPTGGTDSESGAAIYNYVNLPAEFYGAELKTTFKAYDNNAHKLNFEARGDYVEARNSNTGEPLPRISPPRVGASAIYQYQKFGARLDGDYTFAANHISQYETKTEGYLMLNAQTTYRINIGATSSTLYLKATNLLNEEARNHVSFIKDQAPLAGRSFMVGIQSAF